ncbi:MAG: ATP-binding protein [Dechloromonas sp.]|nr:ATP-binding protein [Dechloromonas sp.]
MLDGTLESPEIAMPALEFMTALHFEVRTLVDVRLILPFLAGFFPDPAKAMLGIHELLSNAVEHGSLEMGGERKAALLASKAYDRALARRQAEVAYRGRRVGAQLQRLDDRVELCITDAGPGFDWSQALAVSTVAAAGQHGGRGLLIARDHCFDGLCFEGHGNIVRCWSLI